VEILLLHPGGLGDILLSLPAIALLRRAFPSARFTIAGNIDHLTSIAAGYAERVVSLSTLPLHHLYSRDHLPQEEVRFWKSFDRIVSWTGSGDRNFIRNMRGVHPDARIASWKPAPEDPRHVSQLFVDSLGLSSASGGPVTPARIPLDPITSHKGRQWLTERGWNGRDPLTALHPGAGSKEKRWPIARFIRLAQHLVLEEKRKLLVVEGPAEPGLAAQAAQALPETDVIRIESPPLDLLAAVMAQCRIFVGNDSGLAHLAAALEVPSVVLFGPTLPQHWAPLGGHVAVLRDPRGCKGCSAGQGRHACMNNIQVEEVMRYARLPGRRDQGERLY
jgi:ADP-heptose:LPS heptosyltransferase